jgi:hypothetical protein
MGRTLKTFRQFLIEADMAKMLNDYTSGAIEDYDNTGTFINLFDPNGNGLPKLLSNFNLTILDDDNTTFTGKGVLIKNKMTFNLGNDGESTPVKKMSVELAKTKDGDYSITHVKVM